jgi:hypothetical protein
MTQLRQVEVGLQAREQRALVRLDGKKRGRRSSPKRKAKSAADPTLDTSDSTARVPPRRSPHQDSPMNRIVFGLLALAWSAVALAQTQRRQLIDSTCFHTGGMGVKFSRSTGLRQEPLPWPGHPARATDNGQSGVYRFEVPRRLRRLAAGTRLRVDLRRVGHDRRGADPAPHLPRVAALPGASAPGPVQVRIYKRDAQQAFQPVWETKLDTGGHVRRPFPDRCAGTDRARTARRAAGQGRPAACSGTATRLQSARRSSVPKPRA